MKNHFVIVMLMALLSPLTRGDVQAAPIDSSTLGDNCAAQDRGTTPDGNPVIICRQLNAQRPFVQLPPDDQLDNKGDRIKYVALDQSTSHRMPSGPVPLTLTMQDRAGRTWTVVDSSGKAMNQNSPLAVKNHLPSSRWTFLIYEVHGSDQGGDKWLAKDLVPYIFLDGSAADSIFVGHWEGTLNLLSPGSTPPIWPTQSNAIRTAQVRLTFARFAEAPPISNELIGPDLDSGAWLHKMVRANPVDNLNQGVTSEDGITCIPALTSFSASNPLLNSDGSGIEIYREPNMHGMWGVQVVMTYPVHTGAGTMMNFPQTTFPAAFGGVYNYIRTTSPTATDSEMNLFMLVHGNPNNALYFNIHPSTGGGQFCGGSGS